MFPLTLTVITHNSEKTLEDCLKSARGFASEIIVVDDHSTDGTVEIARKYDARVITRKLESCARQKQFAIEQAANDWVLLLDSDEACPPGLKEEIDSFLSNGIPYSAFRVPRKNFYFGKWLRHGGKYPDYQVRLFKKDLVHYSDHFSHEKVIVEGRTGTMRNPIDHNAYPDIETWLFKLKRTAEFDALEWKRNGIRPSPLNYVRLCILRPLWRFERKFILRGGFLDGLAGLLACLHDVLTQILTYHILSQSSKNDGRDNANTSPEKK